MEPKKNLGPACNCSSNGFSFITLCLYISCKQVKDSYFSYYDDICEYSLTLSSTNTVSGKAAEPFNIYNVIVRVRRDKCLLLDRNMKIAPNVVHGVQI